MLSLLLLSALAASAFAQADDTTAAQAASSAWLSTLDGGDMGATWNTASSMFKSAVTAEAWARAARSVRAPLGSVRSRRSRSATFSRSLPGAPDGQYVVIQYETVFEHKAEGVETVTLALEPDHRWKVAGYFIK